MVAANYDGPSDWTYVVQIFTQPGDTASVATVLDSFNIVDAGRPACDPGRPTLGR